MKKIVLSLLMILFLVNHVFSQCPTSVSTAQLNVNNINATIDNAGSTWLIGLGGLPSSYEAKSDSGLSILSAGGLWIGGIDQGQQLHMAAATYRENGNDFSVGPIDINSLPDFFDTVWVMHKSTIDSFKAGLFSTIPHSIKYWPAEGNPNLPYFLPGHLLAPFVDVNGNGLYDPSKGDYPAINGDEATWEVFNDDCTPHTETGGVPLGIEVHLMTYAFDSLDCLSNTTFYEYTIINDAPLTYDSTYIGVFADPDLGCFLNNAVGCIPSLNMGICYSDTSYVYCNSDFYRHLPLLGIQMVNPPLNGKGDTVNMSNFTYYNNDFTAQGNPTSASQYYGYLTGTWKNGMPFTYGGNGYGGTTPYPYVYPSDPTDTSVNAWSECTANIAPADVRFIMSFGPIKLQPGSILSYTYAVLFDNDTSTVHYPCPSFAGLTQTAQCIKQANVTGVNTLTRNNASVNFYPNPMGNDGTFSFKLNTVKEIKLFNILGQQVQDYTGINGTTLQLQKQNISQGIYFYSAIANNGTVANGKIVIQ